MNEPEVLEKFKAMCVESINPDLFSTLMDDIIPALRLSRKELKPKCGMYGETPRIQIGKLTICEMALPPNDYVWMEDDEADGNSFRKTDLELILKEFYDKNF